MQPFQFPGRTFTIELDGEAALHRLMELAAQEGLTMQARHPELTPFTVNLSPQSMGHLRALAADIDHEPEQHLQLLVRDWLHLEFEQMEGAHGGRQRKNGPGPG